MTGLNKQKLRPRQKRFHFFFVVVIWREISNYTLFLENHWSGLWCFLFHYFFYSRLSPFICLHLPVRPVCFVYKLKRCARQASAQGPCLRARNFEISLYLEIVNFQTTNMQLSNRLIQDHTSPNAFMYVNTAFNFTDQ